MTLVKIIVVISILVISSGREISKDNDYTEKEQQQESGRDNYGQTYFDNKKVHQKHRTHPKHSKQSPNNLHPIRPCVPDVEESCAYKLCNGTVRNRTIEIGCGKRVICLVPTMEELIEKLGGYNRHYVAITEEEAKENFDNLLPEPTPRPSQKPIKGRKVGHHRVGHPHYESHDYKRNINSVKCLKAGETIKINHQAKRLLCPICQRTTQLPDDVFPKFINEITCDNSKLGHSPDSPPSCKYSDSFSFGSCLQKSMIIDVMAKSDEDYELVQSDGTTVIYKQIWSQKTQEIRTCCECFL